MGTILIAVNMLCFCVHSKDVEGFDGDKMKDKGEVNSNEEDGPVVLKLWSWYFFKI